MIASERYRIDDSLIEEYRHKKPDFGYNGLGEFVYIKNYSRIVTDEDGNTRKETWFDTIRRVVEGTINMFQKHTGKRYDEILDEDFPVKMFRYMFDMKFLPAGRGLWAMGTDITEKKGMYGALNSCAFVTTRDMYLSTDEFTKPFRFMTDMSMKGVGVGFDVLGAKHDIPIRHPEENPETKKIYTVPDSREGWVRAIDLLLRSYHDGTEAIYFDYSMIRKKGEPLGTFGGYSSGYKPLETGIERIRGVLDALVGKTLTETAITDIMNIIGAMVVAGGIRRSAQIAFGNSQEFIDLKNFDVNPQRSEWMHLSNNTVVAKSDGTEDYSRFVDSIVRNGEPGVFWLYNARMFRRMNGKDMIFADGMVMGGNPCFTGDMELCTSEGYKTFEELCGQDDILIKTLDGYVRGKVWKSGKKEIIELIFGDHTRLHLTPDHVLMTSDGKEVKAIDTLGKRLRTYAEQSNEFDDTWVKLGFIQGNASIQRLDQNNRHLGFEIFIGNNDDDIAELFKLKKGTNYTNKYTPLIKKYKFDLKSLPYRDLPEIIENVESFLRGLFSANGSIIINERVTLRSTSRKLIDGVVDLLKNIGINTYVTTNKSKTVSFKNGEYRCRESYDINIRDIKSLSLFYEKIGFVQKYKNEKLYELVKKYGKKVVRIDVIDGTYDVYDFSSNGWGFVNGVVAHNCLEQSLESYEMCCLVEVFMNRIQDPEELHDVLIYAYFYGKTVTLGMTEWEETNEIITKNRRIGISMTGIQQYIAKHGIGKLRDVLDDSYTILRELDKHLSDKISVNRSVKLTSVKPSGTVSLLAGATPGIHFPVAESRYYIRRVEVSDHNPMYQYALDKGYDIEPKLVRTEDGKWEPLEGNYVIRFYIDEGIDVHRPSMWLQLEMAAMMQEYWADNQVSVTVKFDPETEGKEIVTALSMMEKRLKGVSFLPRVDLSEEYPQLPYEPISREEYLRYTSRVSDSLTDLTPAPTGDSQVPMWCDNDNC